MNFYYEIKLNFNDSSYSFYEWSKEDKLEQIKKIPLIKVKSNIFKDICLYDFKIDEELLNIINGRTVCKENLNIDNACIFCDTKNCIAIEFDKNGNSIARSSLLLEDENNICEISYSIKSHNINIKKQNKLKLSTEFRQETNIKKIITKEILELYKNKNINKLKYLYYEWFNKQEENIELIMKDMLLDIKEELKEVHYNIYNIIKLSYNKI
jgi:hypothetical protein